MNPDRAKTIEISVLIATRNRAELLRQTLECLAAQQLDGVGWEAVVVDNGSQDRTRQVLEEACDRLPLIALSEPVAGKNRALNVASGIARGALRVFTDDDIIAPPGWLRELRAAAARWPGDQVFCGPVTPRFPPGAPSWIYSPRLANISFAAYDPAEREGPVEQLPFGANLVIRADILRTVRFCETIGPAGADYAIGSEWELLSRLRAQGIRPVYVPTAGVEHVIRPEQLTPRWMYGRAYRYGRGEVRIQAEIPARALLGVPLYVWRQTAVAAVRHATSMPRGPSARVESGMALYRLLGAFAEYRKCQ